MVKWKKEIDELVAKPSLELVDIRLNLVYLLAGPELPPGVLADLFYFEGVIDGELVRRAQLAVKGEGDEYYGPSEPDVILGPF